ncbi:MAG: hypothetical protein M3Y31_05300, partial [Gemmatimonadota bacterium]|nr:hypothetical protein [Gemmatimonadota bacterium]
MFIGHYGVAFALKRAEPRLSLGTLFLAVQLVDLLWGFALLLEWERARIEPGWTAASPLRFLSYPVTHSLLAGVLWGLAAGALYYSWPTRNSWHHARAAAIVAAAVVSHWFLDLIVHVPDLPVAGDQSTKLGLGLWRSVPATLLVELLVLGAGAALYVQLQRRRGRLRLVPFAVLTGLLVVIQLANILGPPPPSMNAVAASAIVGFPLFALAAAWVDRPPPDEA